MQANQSLFSNVFSVLCVPKNYCNSPWKSFHEVICYPHVIDGRVLGAEALLRWTHPVRGSVSPASPNAWDRPLLSKA